MNIIDFQQSANKNSKQPKIFDISDEVLQQMLDDYRDYEDEPETAYDYLELAETSETKAEAKKFVKKALELEPDNIDALVMMAQLSTTSNETLLKKYQKITDDAKKQMTADGFFEKKNIGAFWDIFETRPYMRAKYEYISLLTDCLMMSKAMTECEDMLKLCENDNLGVRYKLMHIYAYFENEEKAIKLFKKYDEEEGTMFLLPLSALYYKLGNFKKSFDYLKKLNQVNRDTFDFFSYVAEGDMDELISNLSPYGYRADSIEELTQAMSENIHFYSPMISYFDWGISKLAKM